MDQIYPLYLRCIIPVVAPIATAERYLVKAKAQDSEAFL
jgi:hypothetical protein